MDDEYLLYSLDGFKISKEHIFIGFPILRLPHTEADHINELSLSTLAASYSNHWPLIGYHPKRLIFTVRKRSCRKVMFSQACVKNSVHSEACMAGSMHGREYAWQGACMAGGMCGGGVHGRGHAWQGGMHGRRDGHCSRWYASYWNAFLFKKSSTENRSYY